MHINFSLQLINIFLISEVAKCDKSGGDDQMTIVMGKVKELGLQFTVHSPCFPLSMLIDCNNLYSLYYI